MKKDVFPSTLNTWIGERLREGDRGRPELNRYVMQVYAEPLRVYFLGARDRSLGEPEEVVEGFFADRLGREGYFREWEASGMRLRRWLMNGFGFYMKELRREKRKDGRSREIDETNEPQSEDSAKQVEAEMDRAFAASVVREALRQARDACRDKGLSRHWDVFYKRYYEGLSYADFVKEYGIDADRASEMARTAAGRFRAALREVLASDGARESEIDEEIRGLLEASCG
jgi:hypothetical protein